MQLYFSDRNKTVVIKTQSFLLLLEKTLRLLWVVAVQQQPPKSRDFEHRQKKLPLNFETDHCCFQKLSTLFCPPTAKPRLNTDRITLHCPKMLPWDRPSSLSSCGRPPCPPCPPPQTSWSCSYAYHKITTSKKTGAQNKI